MHVAFTFRARSQLGDIRDYIARENPSAADAVVARIEHVANILADHPYTGRKIPRTRRRRLPVTPYPYLIYYEVVGDTVRVLRVRHAAQYRRAFQEPEQAFAR